jgi:hypothetical protein
MNYSHQDGEVVTGLLRPCRPLPPPLHLPIRQFLIHEVRSMQYLKQCSYGLLLLFFSFFNSMYGLCSMSVLWTCSGLAALTELPQAFSHVGPVMFICNYQVPPSQVG